MTSKIFKASFIASALFAGMAFAPVMAQTTYTPQIDQTQQNISARIQQGMQAGRITPAEAQSLYRRDREITARESQYKSNGDMSPQERQQIRADLAALSNEVERLIANGAVAGQPGQPGYPGNAGNTPGIDNAQYNVSQRIDEGVRMGRISQREAQRLQRRERQIQRHEMDFKADGVVTQQERRQLRNEVAALRDQIERMIQNDRRNRG
ncbi:hypothetical protein [Polaromonas sp. YR568]|uniref:hypothetical protein n=1 Tax=Polaromonas sp. YR568 TaxID=1855301 RepID=UPI003138217B